MDLKNLKKFPSSLPPLAFPSDVSKWMKTNAHPKMALKLMKTCKYFQNQEFPYFVVKSLLGGSQGWQGQTLSKKGYQNIDIQNISKPLWIILHLCIFENGITELLPNIAVCEITHLSLSNQNNIKFEDFKLLAANGSITNINLNNTMIKDDNGENLPLENIFLCLPNLDTLIIRNNSNRIISSQIATKYIPPKFRSFEITHLEEIFDVEKYFEFILNNQRIRFAFNQIRWQTSVEYKRKLQALVGNLIKNWSTEFYPPQFYGLVLNRTNNAKLMQLKMEHHKANTQLIEKKTFENVPFFNI